jgi:tetratricopeptide (TPR) repeat protein
MPAPTIDMATGEELFEAGEFAEAAQIFLALLAEDPGNKRAANNLGVIAHQRQDHLEAAEYFSKALMIDPDYPEPSQNILDLLKSVPETELTALSTYAFAYLQVHLVTGADLKEALRFLKAVSRTITDEHRNNLIILAARRQGTDCLPLIGHLLETVTALSDPAVTGLGDWLSRSNLKRHTRDQIEHAITLRAQDDSLVQRVAHRESVYREQVTVPGFELYPRRLPSRLTVDDPFMKLVPEGAPSKANGLRVLCISDFNVIGQLTRLMRALNKYTNHAARCVIYQDDYLAYDHDIVCTATDGRVNQAAVDEATALIRQADFFHIGRRLVAFPGIDWDKYISPRNALFEYYGTHMRTNGEAIRKFHEQTGFMANTGVDWTMYRQLLSSFYHIQPFMLEVDRIERSTQDFSGKIRICHAPSSKAYRINKRSDFILETIHRLAAETGRVEPVLIEGVDNPTCLELKRTCHIHVVAMLPGFGFNSIESAAMGLTPITQLDNFTRLLFPDTPVVHATEDTLYRTLLHLAEHPEQLKAVGEACRAWVKREFDARSAIRKYWYLYDLIYHGFSTGYPDLFSPVASTTRH